MSTMVECDKPGIPWGFSESKSIFGLSEMSIRDCWNLEEKMDSIFTKS